ncbi:MAG: hypothetical protein IMZ52_08835 [Actinobacteria bacterium]|nr:hypothetical protein [Actinomycetota bacterium]
MPITKDILHLFKQDIPTFIETGTYRGDGVAAALSCGFENIFSIEAYKPLYDKCEERFKNNQNVFLLQGDSSKDFKLILEKLTSRAVFWLDAHHIGGPNDTTVFEIQPIITELEQIRQHSIKNHTILIDDRRLFNGEFSSFHNMQEEEVTLELKKINSNYTIRYVDSSRFKLDIIVAEIRNEMFS